MSNGYEGKTAQITLTFAVRDADTLASLASDAVQRHGGGVELDGTASQAIVELLLHSNPDVRSYSDYGIQLLRTETADLSR